MYSLISLIILLRLFFHQQIISLFGLYSAIITRHLDYDISGRLANVFHVLKSALGVTSPAVLQGSGSGKLSSAIVAQQIITTIM